VIAYLDCDLGAAAGLAEDVRSDAFKDFTERSTAEKHGQFDLITTEMTQ